MTRMAALSLPLAISLSGVLLLGGCACPPLPEVRELQGQNLATPENAVEYFREAILQQKTYHQYRVFSEEMKERFEEQEGSALSVSNYSLVRDDVRAEIEARVGPLEDVEIGDAEFVAGRSDRAWIELESDRTPEPTRVEMVRETGYSIYWADPGRSPTHVTLRNATGDPLSIENKRAALALALPEDLGPEAAEEDLYRITYAREWKIAWVYLPRFLRGLGEKTREEAPPSAP